LGNPKYFSREISLRFTSTVAVMADKTTISGDSGFNTPTTGGVHDWYVLANNLTICIAQDRARPNSNLPERL
jgi:hypothetical protein